MPAFLTPNDTEPEITHYVIEKSKLEGFVLNCFRHLPSASGIGANVSMSLRHRLEELSEEIETCRGPDGSNLCRLPRFHEGDCSPKERPETGAPKLHETTDASVWAHTFIESFRVRERKASEDPSKDDARGLMLGWFANAIEAGRMAGIEQAKRDVLRTILADQYVKLTQALTGIESTMQDAGQRIDRIFEEMEGG